MIERFINPLDDVIFSDDDIVARCEMWLDARFPPKRREILSRNMDADKWGVQPLPDDKRVELNTLQGLMFMSGMMADTARADMALKLQAMAVEAAQSALAQLPDDAPQRAVLLATVASADAATLALVAQRTPPL